MRDAQQFDHQLAGGTFRQPLAQMIEHVAVGLARPELISIHQVQQRHRLAPECVDHVPVIDDVTVLAVTAGAASYQGQHPRAADEQLHPVIVQARSRTVADEARGYGIKYLAQDEAAGGADVDQLVLIVCGAVIWQWLQHAAFGINALRVAGVLATDDLVDERAIREEVVEVDSNAHQQRVTDRVLQMAVETIDSAVLVRDTAVVTSRFHAVMPAQCIVAAGQILAGLVVKITERGRQTVTTMLERCAAEGPQGILQAFGKRHVTLAAQDDMRVLKTRAGQAEVIQPMIEFETGDTHGEVSISVKSDSPMRPGSCTCRKITSRSLPFSARHWWIRRSMVRRTPSGRSGCRRSISSKIAIGRKSGAALSMGTISASKIATSGSGRRRPRGRGVCDGKRGSFSMRYAVRKLIAAWAAAAGFFTVNLDFMYSLIW